MARRRSRRSAQRGRATSRALALVVGLLMVVALVAGSGLPQWVGANWGAVVAGGALLLVAALAVRRWLRPRPRPAASLGELLVLTPPEFERAVGDLLRTIGFQAVRRVGGAGDLTVDLSCYDPQGRRVAVQCKRYAPGTRIGSPALQAFIGMLVVQHQAAYGIFITTARFTDQAGDLASQHHVTLIDGARLTELIAAPAGVRPEALLPPGLATSRGPLLFRWLSR